MFAALFFFLALCGAPCAVLFGAVVHLVAVRCVGRPAAYCVLLSGALFCCVLLCCGVVPWCCTLLCIGCFSWCLSLPFCVGLDCFCLCLDVRYCLLVVCFFACVPVWPCDPLPCCVLWFVVVPWSPVLCALVPCFRVVLCCGVLLSLLLCWWCLFVLSTCKNLCKTRINGFLIFQNEQKIYATQHTREQQDH